MIQNGFADKKSDKPGSENDSRLPISAQAQENEMLTLEKLKVDGRYNWKNQPERLVYLGRVLAGGWWNQFAKVETPNVVWCEVTDADIRMMEETDPTTEPASANQAVEPASAKETPCTCHHCQSRFTSLGQTDGSTKSKAELT